MPNRKTTAAGSTNVLNRVNASGLIDDSTSIVKKAASVLEEEVAKGILAAKEVQKKFTGADGLRDENKNELIERFRKDVHDIADSLVDMMTMAIATAENIISKVGENTTTTNTNKTTLKRKPAGKNTGK